MGFRHGEAADPDNRVGKLNAPRKAILGLEVLALEHLGEIGDVSAQLVDYETLTSAFPATQECAARIRWL